MDLPKGLHKVMRVEAVLLDETIEQACFALLRGESYLDADGFDDMMKEAHEEKELATQ